MHKAGEQMAMNIEDDKFDELLITALYLVSERECGDTPTDDELEKMIQPSPKSQRRMKAIIRNPNRYIRKLKRPVYLKVLRGSVVALLLIAALIGATMIASPTVRANLAKCVHTWFDDR